MREYIINYFLKEISLIHPRRKAAGVYFSSKDQMMMQTIDIKSRVKVLPEPLFLRKACEMIDKMRKIC